ncbi:hypothetical protein TSTA_049880 [Talaromyces stipitatus ATCC 10500]|uniref:Uncharacterized protein n=1 Tax=Talaromyces stipitatus (strain ATCC 10500 / CBS 375.48 / QM 6759 / NRRL 1006) TaxID=441959 RepID=B8MLL7_TALSN|nr:uncharacterized protein TSTA_049880 [Talaromyces stipitatus ATCC 10500]EED15550.1 hypothetical protein TSTA_049880 [Talaromyces stipitatus ATCC 10500]
MTTKEAHAITTQLQELEFLYAFAKARQVALLRRNAGKRAVDTEILLRETQSKPRDSDRYATAVA